MATPILLRKNNIGQYEEATPAEVSAASAPATQALAGSMSAADKTKLDNQETLADAYQGTWSSSLGYLVNDIVVYAGSSYICLILRSATATTPPSDPTHWGLLASVGSAGSIPDNSVTNAKLVNVATATFKARATAGTGSPEDITVNQAQTLLGLGSAAYVATSTFDASGAAAAAQAAAEATAANADNLQSGHVNVERLDPTVTLFGNEVNDAPNKLVLLIDAGAGSPGYPGIDGNRITNLKPENIASGTLSGVSIAASNLTGDLPAIGGSSLTSLSSSALSGALPGLDGSSLTGVLHNAGDFDAYGSASTAQSNAESYADGVAASAQANAIAAISPAPVLLTWGATITPDTTQGVYRYTTMTASTHLNPPSDTVADGAKWKCRFIADSGGPYNLVIDTDIHIPSGSSFTGTKSVPASGMYIVALEYNDQIGKWLITSLMGSFS